MSGEPARGAESSFVGPYHRRPGEPARSSRAPGRPLASGTSLGYRDLVLLPRGVLSLAVLSSACCVAADTPVHTPRGAIAAGQLRVGDTLWSIDLQGGRCVLGTIVAVRRAERECVALRWSGGELVCTSDHPLYDPERGDYRPAGDWVTGAARRLTQWHEGGPREVEVRGGESYVGVREVVDLTLAGEPRNFVAAGVVVHNKSFDPPTDSVVRDEVTEMAADERERQYRVHACQGGEQPSSLWVRMSVDAAPIPASEDDGSVRLSVTIEENAGNSAFRDLVVPGSLEFEAYPPDDACEEGFLITFGRLDERTDAGVKADWSLGVSATMEDLDVALEVTIEPEE